MCLHSWIQKHSCQYASVLAVLACSARSYPERGLHSPNDILLLCDGGRMTRDQQDYDLSTTP